MRGGGFVIMLVGKLDLRRNRINICDTIFDTYRYSRSSEYSDDGNRHLCRDTWVLDVEALRSELCAMIYDLRLTLVLKMKINENK